MVLSPFAQYHIRKLVTRYVDHLAYPLVHGAGSQFSESIDLNRILKKLCPDEAACSERVLELETLIRMYHGLESSNLLWAQSANQLEQRVFELLGLRTDQRSHSLPTMVREAAIAQFRFPWDGILQESVQHGNEFFGLTYEFGPQDRLRAYQVAWTLADRQVPCVLTASEHRWAVWVSLRSPSYPSLLRQGVDLVDRMLAFQVNLRKLKPASAPTPASKTVSVLEIVS